MYMRRITNRADALGKEAFHQMLRAWYLASTARTVGELGTTKGRPWLLLVDGGRYFHLDADTTRQGVWGYLDSVRRYGDDLTWTVRKATPGVRAQVAFGPHQLSEHEFYLAAYGE